MRRVHGACVFFVQEIEVFVQGVCFLCVLGDRVSVQWCERWMCVWASLCFCVFSIRTEIWCLVSEMLV